MIQEAKSSPNVAASAAVVAQASRAMTTAGSAPRGESQAGVSSPSQSVHVNGAKFARLQESKVVVQQQAISARERIARAEEKQQLMREMRDNLNTIVKNYPPFPPGSEEREHLLNLVTGLRKQIEAVTFPSGENVNPPQAQLPESMHWLPPSLDGASSDADIAMAVKEIEANIETARGFGDDLRQQWVAMAQPGGEAGAVTLSAEVGRGIAVAGQAIAASMRAA